MTRPKSRGQNNTKLTSAPLSLWRPPKQQRSKRHKVGRKTHASAQPRAPRSQAPATPRWSDLDSQSAVDDAHKQPRSSGNSLRPATFGVAAAPVTPRLLKRCQQASTEASKIWMAMGSPPRGVMLHVLSRLCKFDPPEEAAKGKRILVKLRAGPRRCHRVFARVRDATFLLKVQANTLSTCDTSTSADVTTTSVRRETLCLSSRWSRICSRASHSNPADREKISGRAVERRPNPPAGYESFLWAVSGEVFEETCFEARQGLELQEFASSASSMPTTAVRAGASSQSCCHQKAQA